MDLLSVALILLFFGLTLLLTLRHGQDAEPAPDAAALAPYDPGAATALPLTGLSDSGHVNADGAYLPVELVMLFESKESQTETETLGLDAALQPTARAQPDALTLRIQQTLVAVVILLGLLFLLIWLISIF
jgi:hypothetical protein